MRCDIVTLFPEMFKALTDHGMTSRALARGLLDLHFWNPRDFAQDKYKSVDDKPYGGGPGMVMSVSPLREAIQAAKEASPTAKVVYLSPQGQPLDQTAIQQKSKAEAWIFVAGRFEGIDERLIDLEIDEEWSIGDYILTGGELPIMVVIDAMTRWIPGVLGHALSVHEDSFSNGLLEYPQYTRPDEIAGQSVPEVLLSGDHANIAKWRLKQSLGRTWDRRPELLKKLDLNAEYQALLQEYIEERRS